MKETRAEKYASQYLAESSLKALFLSGKLQRFVSLAGQTLIQLLKIIPSSGILLRCDG